MLCTNYSFRILPSFSVQCLVNASTQSLHTLQYDCICKRYIYITVFKQPIFAYYWFSKQLNHCKTTLRVTGLIVSANHLVLRERYVSKNISLAFIRNSAARKSLYWVLWIKLIWMSGSVFTVNIVLKEENSNIEKHFIKNIWYFINT
jgi:hypothetical protein